MGSRILVVEDSAVIRRLIEVCLRAADLEIVTREDGKAGLAAVLDRIRRDPSTKAIPVVVLTAHAEEESRRRANEGGADAFVTKPFQPNDFRSTVLSLLE